MNLKNYHIFIIVFILILIIILIMPRFKTNNSSFHKKYFDPNATDGDTADGVNF